MVKGKIFCHTTIHDDFVIEWPTDLKWEKDGAQSLYTHYIDKGMFLMKYSEVPLFLYGLGKTLKDYSFMDKRMRDAITKYDEMSFLSGSFIDDYESLSKFRDITDNFYQSLWTGVHKGEKIEPKRLVESRDRYDTSKLMDRLSDRGISPRTVDYVGFIPGSQEFPGEFHILSSKSGGENYIAQVSSVFNMLKVDTRRTEKIISDTVRSYDTADNIMKSKRTVVAGSLKGHIERSTKKP